MVELLQSVYVDVCQCGCVVCVGVYNIGVVWMIVNVRICVCARVSLQYNVTVLDTVCASLHETAPDQVTAHGCTSSLAQSVTSLSGVLVTAAVPDQVNARGWSSSFVQSDTSLGDVLITTAAPDQVSPRGWASSLAQIGTSLSDALVTAAVPDQVIPRRWASSLIQRCINAFASPVELQTNVTGSGLETSLGKIFRCSVYWSTYHTYRDIRTHFLSVFKV